MCRDLFSLPASNSGFQPVCTSHCRQILLRGWFFFPSRRCQQPADVLQASNRWAPAGSFKFQPKFVREVLLQGRCSWENRGTYEDCEKDRMEIPMWFDCFPSSRRAVVTSGIFSPLAFSASLYDSSGNSGRNYGSKNLLFNVEKVCTTSQPARVS